MSLAALRQRLSAIVDPPRASVAVVSTGVAALDRVLSDGGMPAGRLTEIIGARGSGKTTLVRQMVASAIADGQLVAYVDGGRLLAPGDWASLGDTRRLWIVRPPNADRSAWCADILLRSGAFSLVVLDGGPPLSRPVAIRLTRLARDHDAALVLVGDERPGAIVGSAVRLRVTRRLAMAVVRIAVEKGGMHYPVEIRCGIDVARRLCAHPEVLDRRGVASRNRRGERATPGTPGMRSPARAFPTAGRGASGVQPEARKREGRGPHDSGLPTPHTGLVLARKRRCAEPVVRHDGFLLVDAGRR